MCFAPQRRAPFRHVCDIATSKSGPRPSVFNTFDFQMCFAPQRRTLFRQLNFQKWSEAGVFCTFSLANVLRATTACTFSTSPLPKVVRHWCALYILTWKCASRHNGVHFFPTCQVRVTRFYQSDAWVDILSPHPPRPPPPPPRPPRPHRPRVASCRSQWELPDCICQLQIAVGTAGLHLPAPDRSGHCRTSCASSRSQWATPDLNGELPIPVGNAGPQRRAPDPSGQRRTSTASSRSQWATPDLNSELPIPVGNAGPQRRAPDPSGQRRTSTARSTSQWATPDLNCELR